MLRTILFTYSLLVASSLAEGDSLMEGDTRVAMSEGYNRHERPPSAEGEGKPLLIQASINLRNILEVVEKGQLISLETTLRLYWKDSRIKPEPEYMDSRHVDSSDSMGPYIILNPSKADNIWMPDIFIDQAKAIRVPTFYQKPASIRIYNDSTVRYSSRFNFDVSCDMNFRRFPVDEQYCQIRFESYGMTNKQIQLSWLDVSHSNVNPSISLAQFDYNVSLMDTYSTVDYDVSHPGLFMTLHLARQLTYHVVQTYIPSTVFVIIAWLSLFVPPESVPGRVGMGMTTLLTLTAMFSSVRQNVPRVSYISLLDLWMLACMIFVFLCILEFIIVTIYIRAGMKTAGDRMETRATFVIPFLFLLFNLIYWPNVLVKYVDGQ